jgi:hypothetical protein
MHFDDVNLMKKWAGNIFLKYIFWRYLQYVPFTDVLFCFTYPYILASFSCESSEQTFQVCTNECKVSGKDTSGPIRTMGFEYCFEWFKNIKVKWKGPHKPTILRNTKIKSHKEWLGWSSMSIVDLQPLKWNSMRGCEH